MFTKQFDTTQTTNCKHQRKSREALCFDVIAGTHAKLAALHCPNRVLFLDKRTIILQQFTVAKHFPLKEESCHVSAEIQPSALNKCLFGQSFWPLQNSCCFSIKTPCFFHACTVRLHSFYYIVPATE